MLRKIELPKEMLLKIYEDLPEEIIQERSAGKRKNEKTGRWEDEYLSYISVNTCIDILNDVFGEAGWSFQILEQWIEEGKDLVKYNKETKERTVEPQGSIAHVKCRLSVNLYDENNNIISITKEAFGSQSIVGNQSVQENIFKSAQSDALKKAASLFGIGAELYRNDTEGIWFKNILIKKINEDVPNIDKISEILRNYNIENDSLSEFVYAATKERTTSLSDITLEESEELLELFNRAINDIEE